MNPRLRANVPVGVDYGTVTGEFVSFVGDGMTNPPDGTPDEVPLHGYVIFTPSVQTMRWPTLVPPKTAVIATVRCPVIEGVLYAPGTSPDDLGDHGVALVASKQPNALPDLVQYIVSFELEGAKTQPPSFRIEVPTNGSVDLSTVVPSGPTSGAVTIVSTEDRERAEAAAAAATASAATASAKAVAASASATAAKTSETAVTAEAAKLLRTGRLKAGELLLNGWTDFSNTLTLERVGSLVTLRGVIKAPPADVVTARNTIMTIPEGFRPASGGIEYLGLMSLWDPPSTPLPSMCVVGTLRSDAGGSSTHANKLVSVGAQVWTTTDAFPTAPYI